MRRTRAAGANAARMLRGGGASRSLAEKRPDEALRGWSGRAVFFAGGSPGLRAVRRGMALGALPVAEPPLC